MSNRESWVKLHTRELNHPQVLRLTWEERGIYWALHLLSRSFSDLKGYLSSDRNPMSDEDIALALHESTAEGIARIAYALEKLVIAGLLVWKDRLGYEIVYWDKNQAIEIREPKEKVRDRQRRSRAARVQDQPEPPTPIRKSAG
jgi:hypothetical protein